MGFSIRNFCSYAAYLWPLLLVFLLGQILMRLNGNAFQLGITASLSIVDMVIFFLFFGCAAWWTFDPLRQWLGKDANPDQHHYKIETLMADFPWRALKFHLIAGWSFAAYLIIVIPLVAVTGDHLFTWRMFVALILNFCFGAGVLAPALAVAVSIVYSTRLRLKLSRQGRFVNLLGDKHPGKHITSSEHRPWLVFMVTGLLPMLILSLYVWLALAGNEIEQQFIFSQAFVLLVMSVIGSMILVLSITRTLKKVTRTLETGLKSLADGHFKGLVPVLIDDDLGELARGLNTAMGGLQEREDLKDSLSLAAEIQQGLLPTYELLIPYYHLKGFQQTCYSVGGDYYDYIRQEDGRVWLVIADVSGKGYPAALIMANLQAMLRGLATLDWPIEAAAGYLNEALCETLAAGRFVTLFMAKLQPESHSLLWVNAGHVPPLMVGEEGTGRLEASAPPLGLVKGMQYEVARTDFHVGDMFVGYTDGVTETSRLDGKEMYGEVRFTQWLREYGDKPVASLPESLLEELNRFGRNDRDDDLTLLCVRREK
ncbi:MAG: SpoIIE family protein phosphatase [Mariprofundus sp.]|nr:SpoIIE family protein phosphatase [Mariprofundus sp.]